MTEASRADPANAPPARPVAREGRNDLQHGTTVHGQLIGRPRRRIGEHHSLLIGRQLEQPPVSADFATIHRARRPAGRRARREPLALSSSTRIPTVPATLDLPQQFQQADEFGSASRPWRRWWERLRTPFSDSDGQARMKSAGYPVCSMKKIFSDQSA